MSAPRLKNFSPDELFNAIDAVIDYAKALPPQFYRARNEALAAVAALFEASEERTEEEYRVEKATGPTRLRLAHETLETLKAVARDNEDWQRAADLRGGAFRLEQRLAELGEPVSLASPAQWKGTDYEAATEAERHRDVEAMTSRIARLEKIVAAQEQVIEAFERAWYRYVGDSYYQQDSSLVAARAALKQAQEAQ